MIDIWKYSFFHKSMTQKILFVTLNIYMTAGMTVPFFHIVSFTIVSYMIWFVSDMIWFVSDMTWFT